MLWYGLMYSDINMCTDSFYIQCCGMDSCIVISICASLLIMNIKKSGLMSSDNQHKGPFSFSSAAAACAAASAETTADIFQIY